MTTHDRLWLRHRWLMQLICYVFHRPWRRLYWSQLGKDFWRCDICERYWVVEKKVPKGF